MIPGILLPPLHPVVYNTGMDKGNSPFLGVWYSFHKGQPGDGLTTGLLEGARFQRHEGSVSAVIVRTLVFKNSRFHSWTMSFKSKL